MNYISTILPRFASTLIMLHWWSQTQVLNRMTLIRYQLVNTVKPSQRYLSVKNFAQSACHCQHCYKLQRRSDKSSQVTHYSLRGCLRSCDNQHYQHAALRITSIVNKMHFIRSQICLSGSCTITYARKSTAELCNYFE